MAALANEDLASLYVKLTAVNSKRAAPGANVSDIEGVLVQHAGGRVVRVPLVPSQYAALSRQLGEHGATPEDAKLLGAWLARQKWLKGSLTLLSIVKKWADWLARARAEEVKPGATKSSQWQRIEQADDID